MEAGKEIFLILDSNSLLHRAFHALPLLTTKEGQPTNAVYGFLLVFLKAIKEFQPVFIAACFDSSAPTFRHKKFKEYKITRPPIPEDLVSQIKVVKEILKALAVPIFEKAGYEADDLIGTINELARGSKLEKIILTGDSDTLQLANKSTKIYLLKKGVKNTILYDENLIQKRYQGLLPSQIVDLKALKGDPSDNIPGVLGIGEKTAIKLLRKFGTIENLYKNLEEKKEIVKDIKPGLKELLLKEKEKVFLSKNLAEIKKTVQIDFDLLKCRWGGYDKREVNLVFKKYEFESLIKRLNEFNQKREIQDQKVEQKTLF